MPNIEININLLRTIIFIPLLLISFAIHEFSHAAMAYLMGDKTAANEGRFTLNPFKHLDLIGSIVLPLLTLLSGGFVIGWAKPVPVNPNNFKNKRKDDILVSVSGPVSNLLFAVIISIFLNYIEIPNNLIKEVIVITVYFNVFLFVFNLLPFPPLDGYHVLRIMIKENFLQYLRIVESLGPVILMIFIFSPAWDYIYRIIHYIIELLI